MAGNANVGKTKRTFINGIPLVDSEGNLLGKIKEYTGRDTKVSARDEPVSDILKVISDRDAVKAWLKSNPLAEGQPESEEHARMSGISKHYANMQIEISLPLPKDAVLRKSLSDAGYKGIPLQHELDPDSDMRFAFRIPVNSVYSTRKDCTYVGGDGATHKFNDNDPRAAASYGKYCNACFSEGQAVTVYIQDSSRLGRNGYNDNMVTLHVDDLKELVDYSIAVNPRVTYAYNLDKNGNAINSVSHGGISRSDFGTNAPAAVEPDIAGQADLGFNSPDVPE